MFALVFITALVIASMLMATGAYTIRTINDLATGLSVNLLTGLEGRTLNEFSALAMFANQEAVTGSWQVTVGGRQVVPQNSPGTLQATVGVMPIVPDDLLILTFGEPAEEMIVTYTNGDGAASREGRLIVNVMPIEQSALLSFLQSMGVNVPGVAGIQGR